MRSRLAPTWFRASAAVIAALLLGMLAAGVPVRADTAGELAAAKAKLNRLVEDIQAKSAVVDDLQGQISVLAARIDAVESAIARTQGRIASVRDQIAAARKAQAKRQAEFDARVRVIYEVGPASSLELILGANSLSDLNDRIEIVNRAGREDQRIITALEKTEARLHGKERELVALQRQFMAQRVQLQTEVSNLEAKLASARTLVDALNRDKAAADKLVKELTAKRQKEIAAAAAAAAAALAAQQQGIGGGGGPSIGGVFSVCPVDPPRGYSDSFGAPRYAGGYHAHAGNDIFAPMGTPIRAPFSGNAVNASNGLGGLSVYVNGSAGYVYNAHLSSIGTLGPVSAGTIVGYVGNSGDAQGTATHDHFEWHPYSVPSALWKSPYGYTQVGSAIDPYPYLNAVC